MAETTSADRRQSVQYLLGLMDEDAMQAFEERYFADDQLFELFEAVEDELIASHLAGRLSADQEQRFQQHYLNSTQRRKKVDSAAMLRQKLEPKAMERTSFWQAFVELFKAQPASFRYSAAFAGAAVVVLAVVSMITASSLSRQLNEVALEAKQERGRADTMQKQSAQDRTLLEAAQKALSGGATLAMALVPITRGGGDESVLRPGSASFVELRLDLNGRPAALRYRVTVKRNEWAWSQEIVESAVKEPIVRIPASLLSPGSYEVEVQSAGTTGVFSRLTMYSFSVPAR